MTESDEVRALFRGKRQIGPVETNNILQMTADTPEVKQ